MKVVDVTAVELLIIPPPTINVYSSLEPREYGVEVIGSTVPVSCPNDHAKSPTLGM